MQAGEGALIYDLILKQYATPGRRNLDTHLGYDSSAIAAHYFKCEFVGCELDKHYYDLALTRFKKETSQLALF